MAAARFPFHVPFHLPAPKFQDKHLAQTSSHLIHFHSFPSSEMHLPDLSHFVSAQAQFSSSIKPFPFWHDKHLHQGHSRCFTPCAKTLGKTYYSFSDILKMGEKCKFIGGIFLRGKKEDFNTQIAHRKKGGFQYSNCSMINISLNMQ